MVEIPVSERLIVKVHERRRRRILKLFIQIHVPHGGINATYSSRGRIISPGIRIHRSGDSCFICSDTAIVHPHCFALVLQKAGQINRVSNSVHNVWIEFPITKYLGWDPENLAEESNCSSIDLWIVRLCGSILPTREFFDLLHKTGQIGWGGRHCYLLVEQSVRGKSWKDTNRTVWL